MVLVFGGHGKGVYLVAAMEVEVEVEVVVVVVVVFGGKGGSVIPLKTRKYIQK
jgi:hypothetical protein